jgi:hypothetical protein
LLALRANSIIAESGRLEIQESWAEAGGTREVGTSGNFGFLLEQFLTLCRS